MSDREPDPTEPLGAKPGGNPQEPADPSELDFSELFGDPVRDDVEKRDRILYAPPPRSLWDEILGRKDDDDLKI